MATLPRVDELIALPIRSQVAFAARCAQRVHHLFKLDGPGDRNAELLVERAVQSAEYFATGRISLEVANADNEVLDMVRSLANRGEYGKNAAPRAGFSACYAAQAAHRARRDPSPVGEYAEAAARLMIEAVSIAPPGREDAAIRASRGDFEKLAALMSGQSSELGDLIDTGEDGPLGPLWPV